MQDDFVTRFGGVGRLVSEEGLERLRRSHVCVVGIGGVGSWVVEALARSGMGAITLIDLDDICVSNINRQIHALDAQVGRTKVSVMAERIHGIHPACDVRPEPTFYTEANAATLLDQRYDCVVDAIDRGKLKAHLIASCRRLGLPVITSGGSGGRRDPTRVRVADLSRTYNDTLLHQVRRMLRQRHGFPKGRKRKFGVPCIFSEEPPIFPGGDGSVRTTKEEGAGLRLNCEDGFGTAVFVTGTFGFVAASAVVGMLVKGKE